MLVEAGSKVEVDRDPVRGSPLYILVLKKDGSRMLLDHPAVAGDDWVEARILYCTDELARKYMLDLTAHLIQAAVKKKYPHYLQAGFEIRGGEARVDFYTYDKPFELSEAEEIAREAESIALNSRLSCRVLGLKDALRETLELREPLLYEYLSSVKLESASIVSIDGFKTICPNTLHPSSMRSVRIIRVTNTSMTHWRGVEGGLKLYSIHVTSFPSKQDEELFKELRRQAELRDHVHLGREMDLFITTPTVGAGLILWTPRGAMARRVIEDFIYKIHLLRGYKPVVTPHIASGELFRISGHLEHFRQNMFLFDVEGRLYAIKPMNCPFHIMILKRRRYSYRDLPVRFFELGTVYRFERAGTLHGLTRVRGLTQDDAHIFMREDQIETEILGVLELLRDIYSSFGVTDYSFKLSTRGPEKEGYMGSPEVWEKAEEALENALRKHGVPYTVEEGEAAFYGPKIDVYLKDALGREWQCGTIQLDFNLPERFNLTYIDADNREKRMVMVHRAILGSIERFMGVMLEYYAGRLPLWVAPVQAVVLPVEESSREQVEYAENVYKQLLNAGVRAEILTEGRLNSRLREARRIRAPLIIVVGRREVSEKTLTVTVIRYGEDERKMYKPREERVEFKSTIELLEWINREVERQTKGVIRIRV